MRAFLLLTLAAPAAAGDDQVKWLKLDEARARSAVGGKPVLVFCMSALLVDGPPTKGLDQAFASETIRLQKDDYHFVKCTDMSTIKAVKATSKCELIIFDPDGDELLRLVVKSVPEIAAAMKETLTRYSNKIITWNAGPPPADGATGGKPMTVLLFADGSEAAEAAVRALEDRRVAKFHDRSVFVRLDYRKDAPETKAWNVSCSPTLILLDHAKEFSPKAALERSSERKTPREMKAFLLRGLTAIEKARR